MSAAAPGRRALLAAAASLLLAGQAGAAARIRLTMATGAAGGGFAEIAPALADIADRHAGIELDLLPTAGSHDNLRLLRAGDADLGLVSMGAAWEAANGRPPFAATGPSRGLRALFPLHGTRFGLVAARRRPAARLADFRGGKIGVGPAGGAAEIYLRALAGSLGLALTLVAGAPAELADRVVAGELDALWFGSSIRVAAVQDVMERADGVLIPLAPEEIARFEQLFPFGTAGEIAAGTYQGQTKPVPAAAVWAFALASERLPDEEAYRLTRAVMEQASALTDAYPRLAGARAEHAVRNTFLPFHPGALRHFAEAGVRLAPAVGGAG
ncbi:TAXI family TRAP transporter solute-binding subunit [Enterovirga sp.]|uniref:TAXI family TRAP transporter solute-binding subunit n=1 Tax=Enterovirga sp. TaxID=2026350 RepID=UPI00263250B5|nr:TAXI family TRAP transporter solute-binding subunit [Enterovirga sp.]MDB5589604.1 hypothetical protein [Enterovirga sp.]